MNRKTLEKALNSMGYDLRETSHPDARWMVVSRIFTYHWDFKNLDGVRRFVINEKAMYRHAKENSCTGV